MRVDFMGLRTWPTPDYLGSARLIDGHVVFDDAVRYVVRINIGDRLELVSPADGERYLRALPRNFRPPYFYAVFIEDDV